MIELAGLSGLSGRDDEPTASLPTLPATIAAAHLTASAAELAGDTAAGRAGAPPAVEDLAELTAVVDQLVAGQRYVAAALARLANHVSDRHRDGALAVVASHDVAALAEVLAVAATATGHAAGALAQGRPVLDILAASAGPDAKI
ncbi:MAG TPA: hypothetical protein VFW65_18725 [Pseudonocardiaceae bacterium]|nr:hypothetical protein [Pseudonocardiaceae bacterium]